MSTSIDDPAQSVTVRNKPVDTYMFDTLGLPQVSARPGSALGQHEPPGTYCYLIEQGLVASYVHVDAQRLTCVGLAGPGDIIGLGSIFGRLVPAERQRHPIVATQLRRIAADDLRARLNRSPALLEICMQQLQARHEEIQHVAACNARHVLPARCAHWLLRLQSRLGDTLPITHEFLASILGVRRAGITTTLQSLQRSGAIRQQRGSIIITAAERLQDAACSCPTCIERPPLTVAGLTVPSPSFLPKRQDGPRAQVAAMLHSQMLPGQTPPGEDDQRFQRIAAVLQVCHTVMEQTQQLLTA